MQVALKKKKKKSSIIQYFPDSSGKIQVCLTGGLEGGLFEQMTLLYMASLQGCLLEHTVLHTLAT